jgi:hypothetical protein
VRCGAAIPFQLATLHAVDGGPHIVSVWHICSAGSEEREGQG